jgi:hypothetical protein
MVRATIGSLLPFDEIVDKRFLAFRHSPKVQEDGAWCSIEDILVSFPNLPFSSLQLGRGHAITNRWNI